MQPLWVSNLARFFLHLRDCKCIANKSLKDLTKISINILSGFFFFTNKYPHTPWQKTLFQTPIISLYLLKSWAHATNAEDIPLPHSTQHCVRNVYSIYSTDHNMKWTRQLSPMKNLSKIKNKYLLSKSYSIEV